MKLSLWHWNVGWKHFHQLPVKLSLLTTMLQKLQKSCLYIVFQFCNYIAFWDSISAFENEAHSTPNGNLMLRREESIVRRDPRSRADLTDGPTVLSWPCRWRCERYAFVLSVLFGDHEAFMQIEYESKGAHIVRTQFIFVFFENSYVRLRLFDMHFCPVLDLFIPLSDCEVSRGHLLSVLYLERASDLQLQEKPILGEWTSNWWRTKRFQW